MSLRNKILLYSVAPVAVVMIAVGAIVLLQMWRAIERAAEDRVRIELRTAAGVIEAENQAAVNVTQAMASAQVHGLFGDRPNTIELARQVLGDNPQFIAAYFGYEPNADQGDRAWRARPGTVGRSADETGRFLPYWFRAPGAAGKITLEAQVDMESSLYYQGMKDKYLSGDPERFIITEPYLYNNKNLIIEQTSPVVIDGKFVGIAGVDRGLDFLDEFIHSLKPFASANLILVSGRGRIIAATIAERLNMDVRTVAVDELYLNSDGTFPAELFHQVNGQTVLNREVATEDRLGALDHSVITRFRDLIEGAGDSQIWEGKAPTTGVTRLGAAARIPTGGWTLVMTVNRDEIMASFYQALRPMLALAVAGMLVGVGALVWLTTRITRRIKEAADQARRVADGDLRARSDVASGDESGALQQSIRDMIASLNKLLGRIRETTLSLSATANELFMGALQQEKAVNEFSASTTEIAAASSEIAATSGHLQATVGQISQGAAQTQALAGSGRTGLRDMAGAMARLQSSTDSIASRFDEIHERALRIGAAVTTISKVSDRTNMLSLNASIEAEKAGEHGGGFALVAREIQRLAEQTAAATVDIGRIVREMQTAVADGVSGMDLFTREVGESAKEIGLVGERLGRIVEKVQSVTSQFGRLNEGMKAQSEGAEQIRDALAGLTDGVRRTEAVLPDFRRASDHLQESVSELREQVGRFRVVEDGDSGDRDTGSGEQVA